MDLRGSNMWFLGSLAFLAVAGHAWAAHLSSRSAAPELLTDIEDNSLAPFSSDPAEHDEDAWPLYHTGLYGRFSRIDPSIFDNRVRNKKAKRFPIHLDPIIPPKYWMRSGECPATPDGAREFFCPTPTVTGKWICVDDHQLCDGVKNCPNADDESPLVCMFYNSMKSQLNFVASGIIARPQAD